MRCPEVLNMEYGPILSVGQGRHLPWGRCLWCRYLCLSALLLTPFGVIWETWAFLRCDSFDLHRQSLAIGLYIKTYSMARWITALLSPRAADVDKDAAHPQYNADTMSTRFSGLMAGLACIASNTGFEWYRENISVQEQLYFLPPLELMSQSISLLQVPNCMLWLNSREHKHWQDKCKIIIR